MKRRPWLGLAAFFALVAPALVALAIPARVRIPRSPQARAFAPAARALFSHPGHEPLRCFQCHPSFFPQAPAAFDHAAMDQGRYCGGCHDARRAPAVSSYPCESCHVPTK